MIPKAEVDTTIDEIHRTRERLAEKFGGDIKAILEDARRRQAASDRPTWQGPGAKVDRPLVATDNSIAPDINAIKTSPTVGH